MMRRAVTDGTATEINGLGQVYGKTGRRSSGRVARLGRLPRRSGLRRAHRGGGSSTYAVRMVRQMLEELPPDFRLMCCVSARVSTSAGHDLTAL